MKKIYLAENLVDAGLMKGLLENQGIECLVKNQSLAGALGELPPLECWPEIWIADESDYQRAEQIIHNAQAPAETAGDWPCECGETIEGQFTSCWNCKRERRD